MWRVAKSGFRRLFSSKRTLLIVIGLIAAFMVLLTWYYAYSPYDSMSDRGENAFRPNPLTTDAQVIYQSDLHIYQEWQSYLNHETNVAPQEYPSGFIVSMEEMSLQKCQERIAYYQYCLDHRCSTDALISSIDMIPLAASLSGSRGFITMSAIYRSSFALLLLAAFGLTYVFCVHPLFSGTFKNYAAAPVSRRQIVAGNTVVAGAIMFALWLLSLFWGLTFGFLDGSSVMLRYAHGVYTGYSVTAIFAARWFLLLVGMAVVSGMTLLIGLNIKKESHFLMIVLGIIGVLSIAFGIQALIVGAVDIVSELPIVPLYNLIFNTFEYFTWQFWLILCLHFCVAATLWSLSFVAKSRRATFFCVS